MIRIDAPAKLNLRLRVLAREESGYHSLETLFCAISLCDEIAVSRAGAEVDLQVEGSAPTGEPEQNLVVRAARRYLLETRDARPETGREEGIRIRLVKRIPAAAGLGGGSSDAAATLRALNALSDVPADPGDLLRWGADLGSDVPFFLCGSALAWGWSRGENLLALPPLPARPVLVAHPRVGYPTADAFQRLAALRGAGFRAAPAVIELHELREWAAVARLAMNDFEQPAIEAVPRLAGALAALREAGAFIALLAGSGASVFGVFQSPAARDRAEPTLAALGFDTWRAETLESMPAPAS